MELKRPLLCRWNFHTFVHIDPTDIEHEELCDLMCRSRSTLKVSDTLLDKVCVKCGHVVPTLQSFLASLRTLRNIEDK